MGAGGSWLGAGGCGWMQVGAAGCGWVQVDHRYRNYESCLSFDRFKVVLAGGVSVGGMTW